MSETVEAPRNEQGQFATDTSNMVGLELEQAQAGFKTRPRDPDPEGVDLASAAADLKARRAQPNVVEPDAIKEVLGGVDTTEALSIEQASKDLASRRQQGAQFIEGHNISLVAENIDAKRAEELKTNPRAADELGLSAEDVAAAKKADLPADAKADPASIRESAGQDATASDDGLDPVIRQALNTPQGRQFIEQNEAEKEQVKRAYGEAISHANTFGHAAILAIAPELQGVPLERWQEGINILAQADPARGQQLGNLLQNVEHVQQRMAQLQQHQAQQQHQQFEATRQQYSKASDAAIGPMTRAEMADLQDGLVSHFAEFGVSQEQLIGELQANVTWHHPAVQKLIVDGIRYQRVKAAPKAVPQALPSVTRPGVQRDVPRASDNSSKISALQRQLEGARGERAARIAGQIRTLKRG